MTQSTLGFQVGEVLEEGENDYYFDITLPICPNLQDELNKRGKAILNGMLNSQGGRLCLGVDTRGVIRGVLLDSRSKDEIRLTVDSILAEFRPEVDSDLQNVVFKRVQCEGVCENKMQQFEFDAERQLFRHKVTGAWFELLVCEIELKEGAAPLYYCNAAHDEAYCFFERVVRKMTMDEIVERVVGGRPALRFEDDRELDFTFREDIIRRCIDFFRTEQHSTRVIALHGEEQTGKSKLAEHIKQQAMQERVLQAKTKLVYLDLKGASSAHMHLDTLLVQLIRSINPHEQLSFVQQVAEMHCCSMRTVNEAFSLNADDNDIRNLEETPCSLDQITEALLNVYNNLVFDNEPLFITMDNVGGFRRIDKLIPVGAQCFVIMTSRQPMNIDLMLAGPAVATLEIQVKPMTMQDSERMIERLVSTNNQAAGALAEICQGIPQYITMLCKRCEMYGLTVEQVVEEVKELEPIMLIERINPTIAATLTALNDAHTQMLSALSVFPGIFESAVAYSYIANGMKDIAYFEHFISLVNMNLVERLESPCVSLRTSEWWYLTDTVRNYAEQHTDTTKMGVILEEYVRAHVLQLESMAQQLLNLEKPKSAGNNSDKLKETILDLFVVSIKNHELCFRIVAIMLQSCHPNARRFAIGEAKLIEQYAGVFAQLFTQPLLEVFDSICVAMPSTSQGPCQEGCDSDCEIWRRVFG